MSGRDPKRQIEAGRTKQEHDDELGERESQTGARQRESFQHYESGDHQRQIKCGRAPPGIVGAKNRAVRMLFSPYPTINRLLLVVLGGRTME